VCIYSNVQYSILPRTMFISVYLHTLTIVVAMNLDPDLNKFSDNFLLEIFLEEICPKKCIHEPNSLATEIPKGFLTFTHTKKVYIFIC
jgi:hypothetical protein